MELALSAITGRQAIAVAIQRAYPSIDGFNQNLRPLLPPGGQFKYLMVSFLDEPEHYFDDLGPRNTVYHLEVGYDHTLLQRTLSTQQSLPYLVSRVRYAVEKSAAPQPHRSAILKALDDWYSGIDVGKDNA